VIVTPAGPWSRGVPEEVLEELSEAAPVGQDPPVDVGPKRRVGRVDVLPAPLGESSHVDRLQRGHHPALASQRQQVVDELVHPFVGPTHGPEVLAVTLPARELQAPLGDVQRVPAIVADDACELVEPVVLPS